MPPAGDKLVASRRSATYLAWGLAAAIPLAFLAVFFLWPVLSLVVVGLGGGELVGSGQLGSPLEILQEPRTRRVIGQTLAQASAGTALSLVLGVPSAFVLYRLRFRGQQLLRGLSTLPFVLPTVVVGIGFTALLGPGGPLYWLGLDQSFLAIVLALAFFNVAVVARTVGGFWSSLDPRQEQAAQLLGASPARVFLTVTLPRLAPAIASAAALVFLFCATSFGVVLVLGGRTFSNVETEIYRLAVQFLDLRGAAVLSLVQFAIVAAVLLVSGMLRSRREQATAMRYEADRGTKPTASHLVPVSVFAATTLLLHALPLATLVTRSLRDASGWTLANYQHLVDPPARSKMSGTVFDAIRVSLEFAAVATALSLLLGLLVALVASRRPRSRLLRRGIALFDAAVMLPLGVSAVTLGFGLLLTMNRPLGLGFDLRTSAALIPIAQALVALPLVVRSLLPSLRALDPKQREAAALLGAGPWRVLATIDLRVIMAPLGLGFGFAFATSLGEFGATSFLVRPGSQTLPVMVASLVSKQGAENYGMALAGAVVLGVITAAVMLAAEQLRPNVQGEI